MQAIHRLSLHGSSVLSLAVSATHIFAGTQDHRISVYDNRTFAHLKDLEGHNGAVLSLILSPDCVRLFSSSGDSIIKVWDTTTLACIHVIYSRYDVGDIFSTAFSAEHNTLYLGCQNTSLQWVNFDEERTIPNHDAYPTRRPDKFFDSTGPGGRSAATLRTSGFSNHHTANSELDSQSLIEIGIDDVVQYAHYSYVFCLTMGEYQNESVLISGGGDAAINIWSLDGRPHQIRSLCQSHGGSILSIAQHESLLYAGQSKGTVSLWDLETNQLLRRVQAHDADIQGLSVLNGCLATIGGASIKLWDISGGLNLMEAKEAHKGASLCSARSFVNGMLVTGGNDHEIAIWDIPRSGAVSCTAGTLEVSNRTPDAGDAHTSFMASLEKLVGYASVSNHDNHMEDCRRAASFLRSLASELGAEASLLPTANNPIILIKFKANKKSTLDKSAQAPRSVLYYGHYDVISAMESSWTSSPWKLTGRDGFLYGRGVSDNKAPILSALFAAHELLVAQSLAVDLTMLIEGEEESGSRGFREAVRGARAAKAIAEIDEVFLSNSYWLDDHVPCLTYGLRGVIHASVQISNSLPDLHSGVEGGSVREPTIDMVNLLAKLTSDTGSIALPGFYEPVRDVGENERRFYEEIAQSLLSHAQSDTARTKVRCQFSVRDEIRDVKSKQFRCEEVVEDLMNRWCRPSLTVHKLNVSGPGNSTIIPHSASANISIRIVPDQDLKSISDTLTEYLEECFSRFNSPNQLDITIESSSDWWLSPPTSPSFQHLSALIEKAWSMKPLIIREGGSIPMVRWLEQEFDATAVHFPMGQSSDCAHLADERLRILNLEKGREVIKGYFAL